MKPAATTDGAAGSSGAHQQQQQLPGLSTMMVGHTRLNVSAFEPTRSPVEESLAPPATSEPGLPAISNNAYQAAAVSIAASHHATAPPASQLQASTSQISHTSSFPVMEPQPQQQTLSSSKLVTANSHGASGPVHQHHPPSQQGVPPAAPTGSASGGVQGSLDSRNFTLSPETTDCDSADLESEVSINEGSYHSSGPRMHTAMPILEDGLSSGHASDMEDDVIYSSSGSVMLKKQQQQQQIQSNHHLSAAAAGGGVKPAVSKSTTSSGVSQAAFTLSQQLPPSTNKHLPGSLSPKLAASKPAANGRLVGVGGGSRKGNGYDAAVEAKRQAVGPVQQLEA